MIVLAFQLLGFALADQYARTTRLAGAQDLPGFNQRIFAAAMMDACGQSKTTPRLMPLAEATPDERPVIEFLELRREAFDCSELPANLPLEGLDGMQRSSPHLLMLTSAVWRVTGPSWRGIDHLLGVMFGLSVALAYLICRVTMGRLISSAVAVTLLLSPIQLSNLADLRDYSKAPFFLGTMLAIVWLVSASRAARPVMVVAAVIGAVLGVGFGIRTDIAVCLPAVLGALICFLPGALRDTWRLRTVAAAVCAIAFTLAATPSLRSDTSADNLWHWALLGHAYEWDRALGIAPGPYETGHFYDDSYVATIVDAYHSRVTPESQRVSVGQARYAEMSGAYYRELLGVFPADAIVRGWASEIRLLDLPYSASAALPSGRLPTIVNRLISVLNRVRGVFADTGVWCLAILALAIGASSLRLGFAVFGIVSYLSAYPAVQFQLRHVFQLEILGLWAMAVLITLAGREIHRRVTATSQEPAAGLRGSVRRAITFAAIVAAFVVLPTAALRAYQTRAATTLLESYEGETLEQIPMSPETADGGSVRFSLTVPPAGSRSISSNMLVAAVGGKQCDADFVAVTFRYSAPGSVFDFTRTLQVPARAQTTKVYFPIFESGAGVAQSDRVAFAGVEVPEAEKLCLTRLSRFSTPDRFRLLVPAILEPGWRDEALYQVIGTRASSSRNTVTYRAPTGFSTDRAGIGPDGKPISLGAAIEFQARPVHLDPGRGIEVNGAADAPHAYLLSTAGMMLGAGGMLVAEGRLERGGLTIGFVDGAAWVAKVDIDRPGPFRALVHPVGPGHYQMVVANHLSNTSLRNRFSISRLAVLN